MKKYEIIIASIFWVVLATTIFVCILDFIPL